MGTTTPTTARSPYGLLLEDFDQGLAVVTIPAHADQDAGRWGGLSLSSDAIVVDAEKQAVVPEGKDIVPLHDVFIPDGFIADAHTAGQAHQTHVEIDQSGCESCGQGVQGI